MGDPGGPASRGPRPSWPSRSRRTKNNAKGGRNWYGGRRLGRLGARSGNVRQGDAPMNRTREERPRRPPLVVAFVIIGLGVLFLATGLNRPSIANMRTVDLVHLLGTGACL